ncbi:MAG: hypothetical protein ROZ37_21180 [Aromatoleum sp.]|jgi:hypothetical protein|uniref:hypothetical protein n=1 Tax=Aromatoleum sp. TaxID=2307007 RepID=UPI002894EA65|nr:hypothetical protein [Aromatoleum sp.]MDT3672839.1 hypothetical protein [Aromatoleum sp.]
MSEMRAKLQVSFVQEHFSELDGVKTTSCETVVMHAVCRTNGYSDTNGDDEDNTYAKYSPQADFRITVANPALFGQFKTGDKYYADFTRAE